MSGLAELGNLWHTIQAWLFPMLEDEMGELDDRHREFIAACETCARFEHLAAYRWVGNGCPPKDRLSLCKAFIAKRVNSHLHDNHGGRHVRVRGAVKVAAHLSFGLLVIAGEQLLTMLC